MLRTPFQSDAVAMPLCRRWVALTADIAVDNARAVAATNVAAVALALAVDARLAVGLKMVCDPPTWSSLGGGMALSPAALLAEITLLRFKLPLKKRVSTSSRSAELLEGSEVHDRQRAPPSHLSTHVGSSSPNNGLSKLWLLCVV